MSNILPQETINALRQQVEVAIDLYGIDCNLYILTNSDTVLSKGVYATSTDKIFSDSYPTKFYVDWSPNIVYLKSLGMYAEDEPLPIIARFSSNLPDVVVGSYVKVDIQYIPDRYRDQGDEFEIINVFTGPIQDMGIVKQYLLAPRRKK